MVLSREPVEFLLRHILERNLPLPHLIKQLLEQFALQPFLEQHFIDGFATLDGFHYGTHTVGDFGVGFHCDW